MSLVYKHNNIEWREIMSKYSYIAAEFNKYGYSDSARLNVYEINAALDKIVQQNLVGMVEF